MTSHPVLSWQQINEAIALNRKEFRQLEEQAAFMRHGAIATARNILRAYDISIDELNTSLAEDAKAALFAHDNRRRIRRVSAPKPALEQGSSVRDAGPLSRLSSTVKTVLANQGLRTFDAIVRAADSGEIHHLQQMGPTRHAQLDAWLRQEREQPQAPA